MPKIIFKTEKDPVDQIAHFVAAGYQVKFHEISPGVMRIFVGDEHNSYGVEGYVDLYEPCGMSLSLRRISESLEKIERDRDCSRDNSDGPVDLHREFVEHAKYVNDQISQSLALPKHALMQEPVDPVAETEESSVEFFQRVMGTG